MPGRTFQMDPPIQTPVYDENGDVNMSWSVYFDQLVNPARGPGWSFVDGPHSIIDFRRETLWWLPVYNPNCDIAMAWDLNGKLTIAATGAREAAAVDDIHIAGIRPRFRIYPSSDGNIEYSVKLTNIVWTDYAANYTMFWNAGFHHFNMDNRLMAGIGLRSAVSLTNALQYHGYADIRNAPAKQSSSLQLIPATTTPVTQFWQKVKWERTADAVADVYKCKYINYSFNGTDWTQTDIGDSFTIGMRVTDGVDPFIGLMANHHANVQFTIDKFNIIEGQATYGS